VWAVTRLGGLRFHPLTPERWDDFAALFGPRGAVGGCWCMYWRLPRREFQARKGAGNRAAMRRIVASGEAPGILAYHDGEAVGWCAVAPRERYVALARSRVLAPVDERPCWSISCFYIKRGWRRRGLSRALVKAALAFVRARGGRLVEAYPVAPKAGTTAAAFAWTGFPGTFTANGFAECARRSPTRPIMRRRLRGR
jgi:GNAT superfamily N-acetyltransferase